MGTIIGTNGMTLVDTSKGWSRDSGPTISYRYEGPIAKADILYTSYLNNDAIDNVTISRAGGVGVVVVTVEDDTGGGAPFVTEETNDVWEVVGQDLFKSIRLHETFNQNANQADMEEVRQAVMRADPAFPRPAANPERVYYDLLVRGVDEYIRSTCILRKTVECGSRTPIRASWAGVDKAWKLMGEEGSPNLRQSGDAQVIGWEKRLDALGPFDDGHAIVVQQLVQADSLRFGCGCSSFFTKQ